MRRRARKRRSTRSRRSTRRGGTTRRRRKGICVAHSLLPVELTSKPVAPVRRYLVKWKGWPDADRTWEPVEVRLSLYVNPVCLEHAADGPAIRPKNLSNCIEILNKYERMKAEREEKAKKKAGSAQGKATPANESVEKPPSNAKLPAKPASESKPRAKAAAETSEEGVSLAELDARRDQAKKKAKMDREPRRPIHPCRVTAVTDTRLPFRARTARRLSQADRSEDAVAKKWEEKAAAKEAKKPRSSAASTGSASSKRKAASPPRPARNSAKRPPEEVSRHRGSRL